MRTHMLFFELSKSVVSQLLREKLEALDFAQRVILPDHPESLFVPAFLRESLVVVGPERGRGPLRNKSNYLR
jgi:hypothetical protein